MAETMYYHVFAVDKKFLAISQDAIAEFPTDRRAWLRRNPSVPLVDGRQLVSLPKLNSADAYEIVVVTIQKDSGQNRVAIKVDRHAKLLQMDRHFSKEMNRLKAKILDLRKVAELAR
jgi:hypothetical protein